MRRLVVLPLLALVALAGCSGGGDGNRSDGSTSQPSGPVASDDPPSAAPVAPSCGDVWSEGDTLPADYDGCMEGATLLVATSFTCSDGRNLYTYEGVEPNLFAFGGEAIQVGGASDSNYASAYAECQ